MATRHHARLKVDLEVRRLSIDHAAGPLGDERQLGFDLLSLGSSFPYGEAMTWMEFTNALVESLAWPVVVAGLAFGFRKIFAQLASGGVKRWKAGPGGLEVEYWDREKSDVVAAIGTNPASEELPKPSLTGGISVASELLELAQLKPRFAVVEAFIRVEGALLDIISENELDMGDRPAGARRLALTALDNDLITAESAGAIEGLAVMRNLAVHGRDDGQLDTKRAVEYLHLTDAVLYALTRAA